MNRPIFALAAIVVAIQIVALAACSSETPIDCLGGPTPLIEPGRVGDLRLDLSLRELRALCPGIHDSIAVSDESADTAVVISRTNLQIVGRVSTIETEAGRNEYHVDSTARIRSWTVTGTGAMLRGNVPLSARFDSLARAYGKPRIETLNGDTYVWFCQRMPEFVFHFDPSSPEATRDKSLAGSRITSIDFPGVSGPDAVTSACQHS